MESEHLMDRINLIIKQRDYLKDQLHYGSSYFYTEVTLSIEELMKQFDNTLNEFKIQARDSLLEEALKKNPEAR